MEDANIETTQAIQSLATLGLRVEDSYGGSGFWQDVMEYARKGKVRVDELKRAGNEIWHFTKWNDPVDALSTFAQVNAQDVLVEETQKTVEEADPVEYECIMSVFILSLCAAQVWAISVNSVKDSCPK